MKLSFRQRVCTAIIAGALLTQTQEASCAAGFAKSQATQVNGGTMITSVAQAPAGPSASGPVKALEGSFNGVQMDAADAADSILLLPAPPLAITINDGLSGLAEEVIPALANPDHFDFADLFLWNNESVTCLRIDVGIKDSNLSVPVTSDSVSGFFGAGGKVFADVDIDASFETTFFWDAEVAPGFNACDVLGALDNVADWLVGLFGGSGQGSQTPDDISYEELTLTAEGLEAQVDLTLGVVGGALQVTSVDQLNVDIGAIDYGGTALLELIGRLADAGLGLLYGDVTDLVNDLVNQEVIPEQEPRLQEMVNDALRQNLAIAESVAFGDYSAVINVAAAELASSRSENTMTMEFDFDISSSQATASCAEDLSFRSPTFGSATPTSSDFDIKVPHWIVAKTIYEAGRQGLFCQTTLMPFSSVPWSVRPDGALTVESGYYTTTEYTTSGFPVSVMHHRGELLLTVPMLFEGDGATYDGSATGDLKVYFKLDLPSGQRYLYLTVTEIRIDNVVGALQLISGANFDMSGIISAVLNSGADILTDRLHALPLLPQTTEFADDLALELNTVIVNDTYTTLGVNIVEAVDGGSDGFGIQMVPYDTDNHVRFPDEDDLPELDGGIRDRLPPLP